MAKAKTADYKGKTALLIDDDVDILSQLKSYLEGMGFTVLTGESQSDGEKLIDESPFDIAVFDLMMEHQDSGFVLCYKAKKKNPDAPVIMITSVTSETGLQFDVTSDDSRSWIKADVILDKDIRVEQLEREIQRLLKG